MRGNDSATVWMTIAYVVIFIFGFFGNACVIYIVASHKRMKSTFNFLIVNMAIGDLLVSLFIMPSEVSNKSVCLAIIYSVSARLVMKVSFMIPKAKKFNCRLKSLHGKL